MPTARIDLTGQVFHAWTVLGFSATRTMPSGARKPFWNCRCVCGAEREVDGASLRTGHSKGCGCTKRVAISKSRTKHGHTSGAEVSPTYWSWTAMRARVRGGNRSAARYYASKGVKICKRWDDFANFLEDMGERPEGMSIDRIDPDGDYEPGNCEWASDTDQANNTRQRRVIFYKGEGHTAPEWARILGVGLKLINSEIRKNREIEEDHY